LKAVSFASSSDGGSNEEASDRPVDIQGKQRTHNGGRIRQKRHSGSHSAFSFEGVTSQAATLGPSGFSAIPS
jgi:hypothetical protein